MSMMLDERDRTQLAYLARAVFLAPERFDEFASTLNDVGEASPTLSKAVGLLGRALAELGANPTKAALKELAARFLRSENDAEKALGRALSYAAERAA